VSTRATADQLVTYTITGLTFGDGGTATGSFTVDIPPLNIPPNFNPSPAFVEPLSSVNITTTADPTLGFPTTTYVTGQAFFGLPSTDPSSFSQVEFSFVAPSGQFLDISPNGVLFNPTNDLSIPIGSNENEEGMGGLSRSGLAVLTGIPGAPASSGNWSGYVQTGSLYTSAQATWVVPTVSLPPLYFSTRSSTWVGIGGFTDNSLIQLGTSQDVESGVGKYYAWYEVLPLPETTIPYPVYPGDLMTASLTCTAGCSAPVTPTWQLSMADNTHPWPLPWSVPLLYLSSLLSAEWIQEAPKIICLVCQNPIAPLSDYGSVTFEQLLANGSDPNLASATPIAIVNANHQYVSLPSLPVSGNEFSVCSMGEGTVTLSCPFSPIPNPTSEQPSQLVSAVLPLSRSVQLGSAATAFATVINSGPTPATGCNIAPAVNIPVNFLYQTTNPSTNVLTGSPNTPVDIAAGAAFAVGTPITGRPPLRSTRAAFPHVAPTLGV